MQRKFQTNCQNKMKNMQSYRTQAPPAAPGRQAEDMHPCPVCRTMTDFLQGRCQCDTILSPTTEAISVAMKNRRRNDTGSWKNTMPSNTVPTAPMPVHTG